MKRLIGTTSSGGQFMTSGFSHVLIAGKDVSIRWEEPIAVLRADRLRLAGVRRTMSLLDRLFYGWHEVKDAWRSRSLGVGYFVRVLWFIGSFVFGYQVRCFGYPFNCAKRAHWDPIVGAFCHDCHNAMVGYRENRAEEGQ